MKRTKKQSPKNEIDALNVLRIIALNAGYSEDAIDAKIVNLPEPQLLEVIELAIQSCKFARMYQMNVPDLIGRDGWLQSSKSFMTAALGKLGIEIAV